ncbi:MAG: hypothetical protein ACRENP_05260 [Longimicrobiales bacterium]
MHRTAVYACWWVLALLALAGCAGGQRTRANRGSSSTVITAAEIADAQQAGLRDLYDLIELSHPRWLRVRGERTSNVRTVVLVYHNTTRVGGVDVLRNYPLTSIISVRFLDAGQAALLPGANTGGTFVAGAIMISTTPGKP